MNVHDDQAEEGPSVIAGTPRDYSEDLYRVYFEVGEYEDMALKVLLEFLTEEGIRSLNKQAFGYDVLLPIQVVPEVVRALITANIAVYQVVRQDKA